MTLTATIYNGSAFPPLIVVPLQMHWGREKARRGWETALLPRGSLKECNVLLKPETARKVGGGGENLPRQKPKDLIMKTALLPAGKTSDLAGRPQQHGE